MVAVSLCWDPKRRAILEDSKGASLAASPRLIVARRRRPRLNWDQEKVSVHSSFRKISTLTLKFPNDIEPQTRFRQPERITSQRDPSRRPINRMNTRLKDQSLPPLLLGVNLPQFDNVPQINGGMPFPNRPCLQLVQNETSRRNGRPQPVVGLEMNVVQVRVSELVCPR